MRGFFISRLLQLFVTMFIVSVVVFFILRLSGDPILVVAPDFFSEEQIEQMRKFWGFDRPLGEQYFTFVTKAITGDFGKSYLAKRPAMELIIERLGYTWILAAAASASIGLTIAIPLGILSALKRNSFAGLNHHFAVVPGHSHAQLLARPHADYRLFSLIWVMLPALRRPGTKAIIMPAVTLGVGMAARLSRMTRSAMLEVLNQDYVRTAHSKGLMHKTVVMRHALRNALIPIVTVFGLQLGWLLGGSVVVESVFSWPGLGRLMIDSISVRDNTVVQAGLLLFFSLVFYSDQLRRLMFSISCSTRESNSNSYDDGYHSCDAQAQHWPNCRHARPPQRAPCSLLSILLKSPVGVAGSLIVTVCRAIGFIRTVDFAARSFEPESCALSLQTTRFC